MWNRRNVWGLTAAVAAVLVGGAGVAAQESLDSGPAPEVTRNLPPTLDAFRLTGGAPVIDGLLVESDWAKAMVATDFVEFEPEEGGRPSQRTEARILYGPEALYVGIRAFDSAPACRFGLIPAR